jgi:hypothetical protein
MPTEPIDAGFHGLESSDRWIRGFVYCTSTRLHPYPHKASRKLTSTSTSTSSDHRQRRPCIPIKHFPRVQFTNYKLQSQATITSHKPQATTSSRAHPQTLTMVTNFDTAYRTVSDHLTIRWSQHAGRIRRATETVWYDVKDRVEVGLESIRRGGRRGAFGGDSDGVLMGVIRIVMWRRRMG